MTFTITSKVKGWKAIIGVLVTLSNEDSIFRIREDGIFFKANSVGNYMVSYFLWEKAKHTRYEISEEKEICFKLQDFESMINRFNKDDEITIYQDEDASVLKMQTEKKEFQMRLLNPLNSDLPNRLTSLQYTSSFDLPVVEFKEALEDVNIVSDFLEIKIENGSLFLLSFREENGKYKGILKTGIEGSYQSFYSTEFVINIIHAIEKFTENVTCSFENYPKPLYLKINIPEIGIIDYYIAAILKGEGE